MVIVILKSFITIPLIAVPSLCDSFFFFFFKLFSLKGKPQGLETLSVLLPTRSPAPKNRGNE